MEAKEKAAEEAKKALEAKEKAAEEARKAVEKAKTFVELLNEWKIRVLDKIENISIDEKNHILKIWKDSYKVSININYIGKNVLSSISLDKWIINIVAKWNKKSYNSWEIKVLLKELLAKGWIEKEIKWEPAKLVIKKV